MESRILQVFYGNDCLPFKDKERSVHFPIVGNAFLGTNNIQKIRFYVDRIGGALNVTWVATTKLPNGKIIYELLNETQYDDEIGEYYAELTLTQPYSALKGDLFIGLSGYQGGVQVEEDSDTGIYSITGTPTIQATGVIKFSINYAPSTLPKETLGFTDLQQVLGYLADFLQQGDSIVVIANTSVDLTGFEEGQIFFCKADQLIYKLVSGSLVAQKSGYVPYTGATANVHLEPYSLSANTLISQDTEFADNEVIITKEYANVYKFRVKSDTTEDFIATEDYVDNNIYEMASASVVLNDSDYAYLLKNNVRIHYGNLYYEKAKETDSQVIFYSVDYQRTTTGSATNGFTTFGTKKIILTKSSKQLDAADINDVFYNKAQADTELAKKQDNLTFDNTPTADSNNPVKSGGIKTYVDAFGKSIDLSLNTTNYKLTATLKDANGNSLSSKEVDLPLESIVVSASYYDTYTYDGTTYQKVIVITLATTSVPTIVPVGDLVSGLANDSAVVHLTGNETIAGNKTFTGSTSFKYDINFTSPDGTKSGAFRLVDNGNFIWRVANASKLMYDYANANFSSWVDIVGNGDNAQSLGNSSHYWKDIYLKGYLSDGNVSFKLSDLYTKSQIDTLFGNYYNKTETNDLLDQKANVNGNYPTMTTGLADNLTPYSEDSGTEQTKPFINQGTGTGNGAEIITTGDYALMKEKQGNTVVINQYVTSKSTATNNGITYTNNGDGSYTLSGVASDNSEFFVNGTVNIPVGHKIFVQFTSSVITGVNLFVFDSSYNVAFTANKTGIYQNTYAIKSFKIQVSNGTDLSGSNSIKITPLLIDLTKMFNWYIPQDLLDNPSNFFRYYQGSLSYNAGELVNADGRYIKCIGMNQWDEEWEVGAYDHTTGEKITNNNCIRSKNAIKVIPNKDYYVTKYSFIHFYDINENYLSYIDISGTFSIPSNCVYIRFNMPTTYGTTYNNDISINLYYEDEARCLTYEQYEVLTNNDTGTEVLRKAGNAHDVKLPDGTIHRKLGVIDLGSLGWTYNSNYGMYSGIIQDAKAPTSNNEKANIVCPIRETAPYSGGGGVYGSGTSGNKIALVESKQITINTTETDAATFKASLSGVYLYFELATPTTEQGTPFSENLQIDDYGNMLWLNTNNELVAIPQGNNIFYPVNYKGFVDDVYARTNGDAGNLVLQSELSASGTARDIVDTQLLNAIGGTLRQCLCVKESLDFDNTDVVDLGTLNWEYQSTYGRFRASVSNIKVATSSSTNGKILSTVYSVGTQDQTASSGYNKIVAIGTSAYVYIKDTTFTDVDTFKSAMKGVLLAYEKA